MKHTRFTIDDILSPDFGRQSRQGQHHYNNDFKKNDDDILHPEIADNNSRITSLLLFKTENHRNNLFLCSSCTDERTSGKLDLKNNNHLFKQCDKYETDTENRKRCSDRQLYGETEEQKSRVEVTCLSDKTSSNVLCSKTTFCSRNHTPKITALPDSGHGNARRTSADRNRSVPESAESPTEEKPAIWPAWVYCTRYSDRPSAGPRIRKSQKKEKLSDEKRPRTAFTSEQLEKLKLVFETNRYLTEVKRRQLAKDLGLNEAQIKIWFQNKRAKLKKTSDCQPLAERLMAQGLYNHKTVKRDESA